MTAAGACGPTGNAPPVTHLLYLHGFRSGPRSTKARQMAAWLAAHRPAVAWDCPQLPPSPAQAMALVRARLAAMPAATRAVVGSSLGGFYATVAAEAFGCRAVLINPAVEPARDLADRIGETTTWQGDEPFHFQPAFIGELQALHPGAITRPERYFALVAKGDEVLDWREMVARYPGARLMLRDGGDHAMSDFPDHLPAIADFLGWAPATD
ncbi:YqiA/YcfP family alpha/beta fold hydrolase [Piscinibacter sakaiensis]|uniref:Putative esterase n=1 Tax=Piscinibacter sakaiensis TaxID=1547922 RepID=A0A0K8NWJ4_PISS1|nr:YqiA/YcfP family alpha/beta fold hydrolase [Piscinibacter sakaiensis]GAP34772.1 putative esterase [Piscinibacter sakaiensis]